MCSDVDEFTDSRHQQGRTHFFAGDQLNSGRGSNKLFKWWCWRGGQSGLQPLFGEPQPPFQEKLTIHQGIFTDDNTFIYCTHCEQLLLIQLRKVTDSPFHVKSKSKLFVVSHCDYFAKNKMMFSTIEEGNYKGGVVFTTRICLPCWGHQSLHWGIPDTTPSRLTIGQPSFHIQASKIKPIPEVWLLQLRSGVYKSLNKWADYIYAYIHTQIHIYIHTYIHTYIRKYIHTYIHTYLHIYIHTVYIYVIFQ